MFSVALKTHSREELTNQFELNSCIVHDRKPSIFRIVAGKRKEIFYTAICDHEDCGKITTENAQKVVDYWNKWNPKTV